MAKKWTRQEALALCTRIEPIAAKYGAHVALTGGCLYKEGARKDVDILIYRIRQEPGIRAREMFAEMYDVLNIQGHACFGWVAKATIEDALTGEIKDIDFFFPEDKSHDLPIEHLTDEQRSKYGW